LGIADALVIEGLSHDVVLLEKLDDSFVLSSLFRTDLLLNRRAIEHGKTNVKQHVLNKKQWTLLTSQALFGHLGQLLLLEMARERSPFYWSRENGFEIKLVICYTV